MGKQKLLAVCHMYKTVYSIVIQTYTYLTCNKSYCKQIACQLHTQYIEGINSKPVTLTYRYQSTFSDGVNPCRGAKYRWGIKILRFSTVNSLYLANDTRESPTIFSTPAGVDPVGILRSCSILIKLEWLGYHVVRGGAPIGAGGSWPPHFSRQRGTGGHDLGIIHISHIALMTPLH